MTRRDLVIIGGGAGGLVVASVASQLGLDVTLIEKEPALGGDCLHYGCVPSKALIHAARMVATARRAAEFGAGPVPAAVDLGRIADYVRGVIDRIQLHDDPDRFRGYGCEVLFGAAEFVDPGTVRVDGRLVRGRRFVIATGSRALIPPVEGLAEAGFLTHRALFSQRNLPSRLLVLGAGPIGIEMAQAFARLGSRVTVLERLSGILPREDPELGAALQELLAAEGVAIHTATTVSRVRRDGESRVVTAVIGTGREELQFPADAILVAAGQCPEVQGLGLDAAGVAYTEQGIQVDARMRTSQRHIFAYGEVCGLHPFTHMAEYQAGIVIANAVFRFPKKADYRVVPRVTYSDPELAQVGLTEAEARDQGLEPTVLRFPFRDIDRAVTDAQPEGLVKLITRRGRILGASLLGAHAGELLHEIALAMKVGAGPADISATIHAYPTLAQVHRRAANMAYAPKLFRPATRRLVRWMQRLVP